MIRFTWQYKREKREVIMKRLACEMCGSTDLVKQDGVFVCQFCGCKYSVDEAKKMMIEGPVDVSGSTIKIDTSSELANLYQIARRAKDNNNCVNAAKYYDMILVKDPTSWEASFYVVYFTAMDCKIAQIRSAAISVSNCEGSVLALIRDHVAEENQEAAVAEVVMRSIFIAKTLADGARCHYNGINSDIKSKYTDEYVDNVCAASDIMYTCGSQIENIFGNRKEIASYAAIAWKAGIEIHSWILPYSANQSANKRVMTSYVKKIGKYDPAYEQQYTNLEAKSQLEAEISVLKRTITNTSTKITTPSWFCSPIVLIFFCINILVLVVCLSITGADNIGIYLIAAAALAFFLLLRKLVLRMVERNRNTVSDAEAQLAKKEAELKELTK